MGGSASALARESPESSSSGVEWRVPNRRRRAVTDAEVRSQTPATRPSRPAKTGGRRSATTPGTATRDGRSRWPYRSPRAVCPCRVRCRSSRVAFAPQTRGFRPACGRVSNALAGLAGRVSRADSLTSVTAFPAELRSTSRSDNKKYQYSIILWKKMFHRLSRWFGVSSGVGRRGRGGPQSRSRRHRLTRPDPSLSKHVGDGRSQLSATGCSGF